MKVTEAVAILDEILGRSSAVQRSSYLHPACITAMATLYEREDQSLRVDYAARLQAARAPWRDVKRKALAEVRQNLGSGSVYEIKEDGLFYVRAGDGLVLLANFYIRAVEQIEHSDGVVTETWLTVEVVSCAGSEVLQRLRLPADDFYKMDWTRKLGLEAIIEPIHNVLPRLRHAAQQFSRDVPRLKSYGHTGWLCVDQHLTFLTPSGGLGPHGLDEHVLVRLPAQASFFDMQTPEGVSLEDSLRSVLFFLDNIPDPLAFPLLCAALRAPLNIVDQVDFGIWLYGETGAGKSSLAAIAQGFFSRQASFKRLPLNFVSTPNSLEKILHALKDVLVVVDDFNLRGSKVSNERHIEVAERVFRGLANGSGRNRCNADLELQNSYFPRGMILSTAEELPESHSLLARMLVVPVKAKQVSIESLIAVGDAVKSGAFVMFMRHFIQWLGVCASGAGLAELQSRLEAMRDDQCRTVSTHPRSNEQMANMLFAFSTFGDFVTNAAPGLAKVIPALNVRCRQALESALALQPELHDGLRPEQRFLRLLDAAFMSGRAHLVHPQDEGRCLPPGWGWERSQPKGARVGWLTERDVCLHPLTALSVAQEQARQAGEHLAITVPTLGLRLRENGMLSQVEKAGHRTQARLRLPGGGRPWAWFVYRRLFDRDEPASDAPRASHASHRTTSNEPRLKKIEGGQP